MKDTGTNRGIHYWESWLECPRRATLDNAARAAGELTSKDTEQTLLGKLVHQYLQAYYMPGSAEPIEVTSKQHMGIDERARLVRKAEMIFRAYRAQFPADEFGFVEDVEWMFPRKARRQGDPRVKVDKKRLLQTFQTEVTGRMDMVVRFTSRQADRFATSRGVMVYPGRYIVDHKTMGHRYESFEALFRNSYQMQMYCLAYSAVYPRRQVNGYIINGITTGKRPEFHTLVCEYPNAARYKRLVEHLRQCAIMRGFPNLQLATSQCFFPHVCKWLAEGACER